MFVCVNKYLRFISQKSFIFLEFVSNDLEQDLSSVDKGTLKDKSPLPTMFFYHERNCYH